MKKSFILVCLMLIVFLLISCNGDRGNSSFVGRWYLVEGREGGNIPQEIELLKDGTGFALGQAVTWKTENNRLYITHPNLGMTFDYKLTGSKVELTDNDRQKFVYINSLKLGGTSDLIGTWEFEHTMRRAVSDPNGTWWLEDVDGTSTSWVDVPAIDTYTFIKDGTCKFSTVFLDGKEDDIFYEGENKWIAEDGVLYFISDNGVEEIIDFEIKGKTLTLTYKRYGTFEEYKKK